MVLFEEWTSEHGIFNEYAFRLDAVERALETAGFHIYIEPWKQWRRDSANENKKKRRKTTTPEKIPQLESRHRDAESGRLSYECSWSDKATKETLSLEELVQRYGRKVVAAVNEYDVGCDAEQEIECLMAVRGKNPHLQYLVRWKGYTKEFDTWEPVEHLGEQASALIEAMQKK